MAVTSPDNIWTPDAGDDYALTTDLASTADSVQDALNAVRGDNRAFSGLEGDRPAPGVEGRTWYSTDTNRSWFDTGANWISNDGGLYLIRPTGTIGSGVTIGADGTVTFTSAAATGAGFSGAFSTRFKSYAVHYGLTHANSNLQARLVAGGSAISTSSYVSSSAYISGSTVTAVSTTTSAGLVNQVVGLSHTGVVDLFDPADAAKNTSFNCRGTAQELPAWGGRMVQYDLRSRRPCILPGSGRCLFGLGQGIRAGLMALLPMPFGNPRTYANHSGVDFPQREGTSIRASASGYVVSQGWSPVTPSNPRAAGNWITVKYDGGPRVFMCHLRDRVTCPRNNSRFEYGDHLGPVGWTGFVYPPNVNGSHLHLAIDGEPGYEAVWKYFDPTRVVGDGSGAGGGSVSPTPPVVIPNSRKGNNMIRFLYAYNSGPQWTVIDYANTSASRAYTQADADRLAVSVGFAAETVSAQALANAIRLAEDLGGKKIRYIN